MGNVNFSDEFKRDAVAQITERGYRVAEVSERLGVSQHSLYAWKSIRLFRRLSITVAIVSFVTRAAAGGVCSCT